MQGPGQYKTNNLYEVGERVILTGLIRDGSTYVDYRDRPKLVSLERVFLWLDGQGGRTKNNRSELEEAIDAAPWEGRAETTYFELRKCRNRNIHLRFKRKDLLAKFNAIAGGAVLKPTT